MNPIKHYGPALIRRYCFSVLALIVLSASAAIVGAAPLWEAGGGLACLYLPDYRGANQGDVYVLPYPYLIYRGDFLRVEDDSVSGRIFKSDRVLLDLSFFGSVPVNSDDNSTRQGMPDLDPTFETGPALDIKIFATEEDGYKLSLNLPVRAVFSTDFSTVRHRGWVFSPRINFEAEDITPGSGIGLGLSAGPLFADHGFHDYYYSINPAYATPDRPAYTAGSGYSGTTVTLGLSKKLDSLILKCFFSADFLEGAAIEKSPLVKDKCTVMTGITISWVMLRSNR